MFDYLPKRTAKPETVIVPENLTGYLLPWDGDQPVTLRMPNSLHLYLAIFRTSEGLVRFFKEADETFQSIKQITDGRDFMEAAAKENDPAPVIIVDPYFTPEGRVRFTQVTLR